MLRKGKAKALMAAAFLLSGCAQSDHRMSNRTASRGRETAPFASMPNILPETYYAAGQLFEAQGLRGKAIMQYRKAVAVNHNYADAYHRLGVLLGAIGKHEQAAQQLRRALEITPDDPILLNNLGFELVLQENWAQAVEEFKRAIEFKPNLARAHINLGMALSQLDRFDEALDAFESVLPEPDAYYNLGLMLRGRQRYEAAAEAFRHARSIAPNFTAASHQLEQLASRLAPAPTPAADNEADVRVVAANDAPAPTPAVATIRTDEDRPVARDSASRPPQPKPAPAESQGEDEPRATRITQSAVVVETPPPAERESTPDEQLAAGHDWKDMPTAYVLGIENPLEYPAPPGYGLWFELYDPPCDEDTYDDDSSVAEGHAHAPVLPYEDEEWFLLAPFSQATFVELVESEPVDWSGAAEPDYSDAEQAESGDYVGELEDSAKPTVPPSPPPDAEKRFAEAGSDYATDLGPSVEVPFQENERPLGPIDGRSDRVTLAGSVVPEASGETHPDKRKADPDTPAPATTRADRRPARGAHSHGSIVTHRRFQMPRHRESASDLTVPPGVHVDASLRSTEDMKASTASPVRRPRPKLHVAAPKVPELRITATPLDRRKALAALEKELASIRREIDCWTEVVAEDTAARKRIVMAAKTLDYEFVPVTDFEPALYPPTPPDPYPCPGPLNFAGDIIKDITVAEGDCPDEEEDFDTEMVSGPVAPETTAVLAVHREPTRKSEAQRPTLSGRVVHGPVIAPGSSRDGKSGKSTTSHRKPARPHSRHPAKRSVESKPAIGSPVKDPAVNDVANRLVDDWNEQFGNVEDLFSIVRNEVECWEAMKERESTDPRHSRREEWVLPLDFFGLDDDPFGEPGR